MAHEGGVISFRSLQRGMLALRLHFRKMWIVLSRMIIFMGGRYSVYFVVKCVHFYQFLLGVLFEIEVLAHGVYVLIRLWCLEQSILA